MRNASQLATSCHPRLSLSLSVLCFSASLVGCCAETQLSKYLSFVRHLPAMIMCFMFAQWQRQTVYQAQSQDSSTNMPSLFTHWHYCEPKFRYTFELLYVYINLYYNSHNALHYQLIRNVASPSAYAKIYSIY